MRTAGIWPTRTTLVAVVVDDAGRARPPIVVRRHDALPDLVAHLLEEIDSDVVVLDLSVRKLSSKRSALLTGARVWVAPQRTIDPIREACALRPRAIAAMLARLPRVTAMRSLLHRHVADPRQLTLL